MPLALSKNKAQSPCNQKNSVVPYIAQNNQELDLKTLFPFELDDFQKQAIAALNAGKSVVVCAPTGSGKTLIGEYAIYRALSRGKRVFYTTPLKALSNQKLRDFRQRFGPDQVGLLTGDISVNRDAPILVMTTEIFRNMLYGTPIGEVGTSLVGVEAVVLDECHYMNDRQRGTVWEESIIYCPTEIQLVALSATVANSSQLTDWIAKVHGPTELIYSDFRPVPLEYHFCNEKGLFPLLDEHKQRISPRLISKKKQKDRSHIPVPSLADLLSQLQERDMLPAIYFIFSRRGCDAAVDEVKHLSLVTEAESAELRHLVNEFLARNPEAGRTSQIEPLCKGIASHHAGILPAWKGLVEELFQKGLIRVVFATETLAAGINMPARTTVISSLSKRTDDGHRLLKPSEFLQMSGRAGRRGMDPIGHVVAVQTRFEGAVEAAYLATKGADPLVSQFTASYGMVLNLLQTHRIEAAKELIERSFGQYLSALKSTDKQQEIDELIAEYNRIEAQLTDGGKADISELEKLLNSYEKLQSRLKEERRLFKTLQHQAEEALARDMAVAIPFAVLGTILSLKGKHIPTAKRQGAEPVPAVLVAKTPGTGQAPHLVCLGKDNRWYVCSIGDVVALHAELPRLKAVDNLEPPPEMPLRLGQCRRGDETSAALAQQIPTPELHPDPPELKTQQQRVVALEVQLDAHPLHEWGNPATIFKRLHRLVELHAEITKRQEQLKQHLAFNWEEFLCLRELLQRFGCLDAEGAPTVLGEATAAIRGDNELWLGLALMSGELDNIDPHHLAAACAALVTEQSRPDSHTSYELSDSVHEVLGNLQRNLRRALIQMQRRCSNDLRQRFPELKLPHDYSAAPPVWLEGDLVALVEQWALGVEWPVLIEHTSLDEGDVVRILRRTLDFLSQIPHVPHVSEPLRINAYRAMRLIDRFPVNEAVE